MAREVVEFICDQGGLVITYLDISYWSLKLFREDGIQLLGILFSIKEGICKCLVTQKECVWSGDQGVSQANLQMSIMEGIQLSD